MREIIASADDRNSNALDAVVKSELDCQTDYGVRYEVLAGSSLITIRTIDTKGEEIELNYDTDELRDHVAAAQEALRLQEGEQA